MRKFSPSSGTLRPGASRDTEMRAAAGPCSVDSGMVNAIPPGFAASDLRFNLSHSQDLAMYAFVLERDVGVDIETVRADIANERIAENFFSRWEVESHPLIERQSGLVS